MISSISYNKPIASFKSSSVREGGTYTPKQKKPEISYTRAVGVSALLGTSVAGFTGIFCKMKTSLLVGLGVMGLSLLLGIPDKMYRHEK